MRIERNFEHLDTPETKVEHKMTNAIENILHYYATSEAIGVNLNDDASYSSLVKVGDEDEQRDILDEFCDNGDHSFLIPGIYTVTILGSEIVFWEHIHNGRIDEGVLKIL